jgi:VanZ family protein
VAQRVAGKLVWTVTILYWCGIFYLTHLPGPKVPVVPISDKIEHYLAFGTLGGLLFLSFWVGKASRRELAFRVLFIGMCYGAFDELTQALPFVHRDCNFLDWCADVAGVSTAIVAMTLVRRLLFVTRAR